MSDATKVRELIGGDSIHKKWRSRFRSEDVEPMLQLYFRYLVQRLQLHPGMRILDAGCGTAFHAIRLAQMGLRVDGIDYSQFAIDQALDAVEASGVRDRVSLRQGDITSLDIADDSYDAVLCLGVLMHVPDIDAAIRELSRVLKPGGVLLLSESNRNAPEHILQRIWWRFFSKQNIRVEVHDGYTNAWHEQNNSVLLSRSISVKWVIGRLKAEGLVFSWRKSGVLTNLYAGTSGRLRQALIRLNVAWFRFGGPAALAIGNYFAFRKPGAAITNEAPS